MLDLPKTLRVRKQAKAPDEWGAPVYLDEWEDVGAAHFGMAEDRFQEALEDVYKDWVTVFKAPATFRARLTLTGNTKTSRREAARRQRKEALARWVDERCVLDPEVEERATVLVADSRRWHEAHGLAVPAPGWVGRVVARHAVGRRGGTGRARWILGVALKDA